MERNGLGREAAEISPAAAPVFGGVAVQYLPPESFPGHADPVSLAGDGSEVADHQDGFIRVRPLAEVGDDAAVGVLEINPIKTPGGEILLVQGGVTPVEMIEVPDPPLEALVGR
jgi:hypothetical protein